MNGLLKTIVVVVMVGLLLYGAIVLINRSQSGESLANLPMLDLPDLQFELPMSGGVEGGAEFDPEMLLSQEIPFGGAPSGASPFGTGGPSALDSVPGSGSPFPPSRSASSSFPPPESGAASFEIGAAVSESPKGPAWTADEMAPPEAMGDLAVESHPSGGTNRLASRGDVVLSPPDSLGDRESRQTRDSTPSAIPPWERGDGQADRTPGRVAPTGYADRGASGAARGFDSPGDAADVPWGEGNTSPADSSTRMSLSDRTTSEPSRSSDSYSVPDPKAADDLKPSSTPGFVLDDEGLPTWADAAPAASSATTPSPARASENASSDLPWSTEVPAGGPTSGGRAPEEALASSWDPSSARPSGFPSNPGSGPDSSGPESATGPTGLESLAMGTASSARAAAPTASGFVATWQQAEEHLRRQEFRDALSLLSPYDQNPDLTSEQGARLAEMLDALAGEVIYSPSHTIEPAFTAEGQTLAQIAQDRQLTPTFLARINGLPDSAEGPLPPGQPLKVVRGPFRAVVKLTPSGDGTLTLYLQEMYAGRFPIRAGEDPVLPGRHIVQNKQTDRPFYPLEGEQIPGDHPANPYGGIWIDLGSGMSLHGSGPAADPRQGCLILSRRDAADVAAMLTIGSRVEVVR